MTNLIPKSDFSYEKQNEIYTNLLMPDLIKHVSIYIVKENLKSSFYNLSDFYLKHKINNEDVKNNLKNNIIKLLNNKGYHLAYVFNKTGLIITTSTEQLHENIWKNNLDFLKI